MSQDDDGTGRLEDQFARYVVSPELLQAMGEAGPAGDAALAGGDPSRRRADVARDPARRFKVIIEVSWDHRDGREGAQKRIVDLLRTVIGEDWRAVTKPLDSSPLHVFTSLWPDELRRLLIEDQAAAPADRAIYKIWPDHKLEAFLDRSVKLIKADACHRTFEARGEGIVWAVIDSGVEGTHPHFRTHANLDLETVVKHGSDALNHRDFTSGAEERPLVDVFGHGTHVAGILGGVTPDGKPGRKAVKARDEHGAISATVQPMTRPVSGVAPAVRIVSLKVLDDAGEGEESSLIAALEYVARVNAQGERLRIHGVNISLGYPFLYPEWFASGRSPACMQVNRLVDQGVVVVVAAGNDGSAFIKTEGAQRRVGLDQSIADPGNAEKAITVGSTHGEEPYRYGVSYFSSKGPTADGRLKPDILAPGERILSCASGPSFRRLVENEMEDTALAGVTAKTPLYRQDTGTSMAAPHVSGAIAAFMSARSELIGEPARIKQLIMDNASDLGRKRDFQGAGLIDLMRAMQAQTLRKDRYHD